MKKGTNFSQDKDYVLVALARLLCPWNSPGKNGVGCHSLFQGLFLTQGSNPSLLHCRQILYSLSHQGSPTYHLGLSQALPSWGVGVGWGWGGGGVGVGWGWGWGACYRETVAARPLERDPECAQAGGLASPAVSVAAGDRLRGECAQRWSSAFSQGPSSSGLAGEPGAQGQAEGCVLPAELQSPRPGLQAEANLSLTSASSA